VAALAAHYDTLGVKVTLGEFPEYFDLVRSADSSIVPERAWQEILEWLGPSASVSRREATAPIQALECISMPGMTERATMVGQDGQFGMLCEPDAPRANGPAFLFTNTGGNHHVGDCRMYVMLARQLAQMGYASVRMDISLMGDSVAPEHELNIPQLYASGIPHRDVTGAIEWMRARGHDRVIVMGICSGAYHAFHAALACPTVVGAVIINVVKFRWESEDGKAGHAPGQSIRVYRAALANPGNWVKLITGRLNVMPHAVSLMHRLRRRLTERVGQRVNALRGRADDATPTGFARQAMLDLERRGVLTDLVYGAGDIGLDEARTRLGAQFEVLDELDHVNAFVFERFDHALFLPESRATLRAHLFQHIERQQARARSGIPVPAVATPDIAANSVRA
jgi:pimeloyl-ACP methyl ester carboxylesterase